MLSFENDYSEGAHPKILERLAETNFVQTTGYGNDPYCAAAKEKIRTACGCPEADIFFLVGGTQANKAGIDALLDEEVQRLAWENHGFRTEVSGTDADEDHFGVPHLAAEITQVAAMPSYAAMEKIIAALS